jgi:hypothetical protein
VLTGEIVVEQLGRRKIGGCGHGRRWWLGCWGRVRLHWGISGTPAGHEHASAQRQPLMPQTLRETAACSVRRKSAVHQGEFALVKASRGFTRVETSSIAPVRGSPKEERSVDLMQADPSLRSG